MKYLPSVVAALVALLGVFADPVQGFVSAHPAVSTVLGALMAILAHLAPQPQK